MLRTLLSLCLLVLCSACFLNVTQDTTATRPAVVIPSVTAPSDGSGSPISLSLPNNLYDSLPVMQGICFEAAWDAAGRVFIMRSAEEHIAFYDAADHAALCRHPVVRYPFDFSGGDVLAGLWNRGSGCTARHEIINYQRDDAARTVYIEVQFITEGDCAYELLRGFWLGIQNAQAYDITIDWHE